MTEQQPTSAQYESALGALQQTQHSAGKDVDYQHRLKYSYLIGYILGDRVDAPSTMSVAGLALWRVFAGLEYAAYLASGEPGCPACLEMGPRLTAPGTSGRSWSCHCGTTWLGSPPVDEERRKHPALCVYCADPAVIRNRQGRLACLDCGEGLPNAR